jgi:lysophospholipase L1-like esterase
MLLFYSEIITSVKMLFIYSIGDDKLKTIVCFGDSNTWGYSPSSLERYSFEERWTSVLQKELGPDFFVIPEGLNGRTTCFEDPVEKDKNGYRHLKTVLEVHKPLDLIIIILGTNDLKTRFGLCAQEIALSAGNLVDYTLRSCAGVNEGPPEILFIAPPEVQESPPFGYIFRDAVEKSKDMGMYYKEKAEEFKVPFLDASDIVVSSPIDGIHWEEEEHKKFAKIVAKKVKEIIENQE